MTPHFCGGFFLTAFRTREKATKANKAAASGNVVSWILLTNPHLGRRYLCLTDFLTLSRPIRHENCPRFLLSEYLARHLGEVE